jgi:hypothetical protein
LCWNGAAEEATFIKALVALCRPPVALDVDDPATARATATPPTAASAVHLRILRTLIALPSFLILFTTITNNALITRAAFPNYNFDFQLLLQQALTLS